MKRIKNVQHALKVFAELAIKCEKALDDGQAKRANAYFDKIHQIVIYLKEQQAVTELTALLQHSNDYVRAQAANYLLPIHEKQCLKILKEIVKKHGTPAVEADLSIILWTSGESKEYLRSIVL